MNTRILEKEFDYVAPQALDEALSLLSGEKAVKILAGGTDLVVKLKLGADIPMDIMLDISHIESLCELKAGSDGGLSIGAAAKLSAIEAMSATADRFIALKEAIGAMASVSVRNMATLGGNVCNASPVADCAGPLMCYGAKLILQSQSEERAIPVEDFFLAPGVTAIKPGELLTRIELPKPPENTGAAFIKMGRVKSDIAKISVTAVISRNGDAIASCRLAMGSVAATPLYLKDISAALVGKSFNAELAEKTANAVSDFIKPIDDNRTTAEYRKDMARLLVKDAMTTAWERSFGGRA